MRQSGRLVAALIALAMAMVCRGQGQSLWELAQAKKDVHRFSTLFTAQDVRDSLSTQEGLAKAVAWCRATGVTHVYVETFRDGYQAEKQALMRARDRFRAEGLAVSGCVTTTQVGKRSTGWNIIACYTDAGTQDQLQGIFEYTAGLFDEIMIDDFWFTDCTCPACEAGRRAKVAVVGGKRYPVNGDRWEDYRCELMTRISEDRILAPAKKVNPKVKVIVKYPQWYDNFHERGYEVRRETAAFDRIWVGTETRDYGDQRWGGTPQYEAYFIMRWLGGIGGEKCGGGWFDPYGTTQATYVEQARQTVLGGAKESLLFCYGSLQRQTGPKNIEALRANVAELLEVAERVKGRRIVGIAAYKPVNSHGEKEKRIYDFVGMMGLPLVPCDAFPADAQAGFFPVHAMKDPRIVEELGAFVAAGKPTLVTDALAKALEGKLDLHKPNVMILEVKGDPKSLLKLDEKQVNAIRAAMKVEVSGPNRLGVYLYADGSWVVENFNDEPARVTMGGTNIEVAARGWKMSWR